LGEKIELQCGLIMPIAPMLDYSAEHWLDVKSIITQAVAKVSDFKFNTDIVSNSNGEIDVIHKRIVQNLFNADIVICDISGRNPNVLFELGMRLTFDKPTIIIKDDKTDFIFDTGIIEHLTYPRDLNFHKIVHFQSRLAHVVKETYTKSKSDPTYSTFLGNFGEFKVPALDQVQVSNVEQLILDEISALRKEVNSIKTVSINNRKNVNSTDHIKEMVGAYLDFVNEESNPKNVYESIDFRKFLENNGIDWKANEYFIKELLNQTFSNEIFLLK